MYFPASLLRSVLFGTGSGFNLHGRISVPYFLQLSGGFQCCNGVVNILKENRISLADGNGVGFGSEGFRQISSRSLPATYILPDPGQ